MTCICTAPLYRSGFCVWCGARGFPTPPAEVVFVIDAAERRALGDLGDLRAALEGTRIGERRAPSPAERIRRRRRRKAQRRARRVGRR